MADVDMAIVCACCGSPLLPSGKIVFDDRYGYPDSFHLANCPACGVVETLPRLTEEELPGLYTRYYPRREMGPDSVTVPQTPPNHWKERFSRWWHGTDNQGQYSAKPGMTVLDYGCGAGQSLLDLRAIGADPYGIEADGNVARIAAHHHLKIHIGSIYDNPFPQVRFDLIILNQVLEHIPEPRKVLDVLAERLNKGGQLVVAVPNVNSVYCQLFGAQWINWHIPYHLHHFNKTCLEALGQSTGWRLIHTRSITPNLWTVLQLRALMSPAQQGVPNPMWAPWGGGSVSANRPNFFRRLSWKVLQMVTRIALPLMAVFNRIVDRLGFGDSLLFVFVRR